MGLAWRPVVVSTRLVLAAVCFLVGCPEAAERSELEELPPGELELDCEAQVRASEGAVLFDATVSCNVSLVAPYVVPGTVVTHLVTSTDIGAVLFDLVDDGIVGEPLVAEALAAASVRVGPGGSIVLAGGLVEGGLGLAGRDEDGLAVETVVEAERSANLEGFEVASDGTVHLWYAGGDGQVEAVKAPGEGWSYSAPAVLADPDSALNEAFTLDRSGRSAAFAYVANKRGRYVLRSLIDGETMAWGSADEIGSLPSYRFASSSPGVGESADIVVALHSPGQMHIVFDAARPIDVPSAGAYRPWCPSNEEGCPPCHEQAGGVADGRFSLTRTDSADVWVAYAFTQSDIEYTYHEDCNQDGDCSCVAAPGRDDSTHELRIARVRGGAAEQVLSLPIDEEPRSVSIRAVGAELGVGLRFDHDARVLRIDTTSL